MAGDAVAADELIVAIVPSFSPPTRISRNISAVESQTRVAE